jgi:hypothetical protein
VSQRATDLVEDANVGIHIVKPVAVAWVLILGPILRLGAPRLQSSTIGCCAAIGKRVREGVWCGLGLGFIIHAVKANHVLKEPISYSEETENVGVGGAKFDLRSQIWVALWVFGDCKEWAEDVVQHLRKRLHLTSLLVDLTKRAPVEVRLARHWLNAIGRLKTLSTVPGRVEHSITYYNRGT